MSAPLPDSPPPPPPPVADGREHVAVGVARVVAPSAGTFVLAVLGLVTGPEAVGALLAIAGAHVLGSAIARVLSPKARP